MQDAAIQFSQNCISEICIYPFVAIPLGEDFVKPLGKKTLTFRPGVTYHSF